MTRRSVMVTLSCIMVFMVTGCGVLFIWPTKIGKIKGRGAEYLGREVIIEGIVKEHVTGIPELSEFDGSFIIDDGSGTMIVLDKGVPPVIMSKLGVKGIVKRVITSNTEELALQKLYPVSAFGPDARDWVMAAVIFGIGFGAIMWIYNVTLFNWALHRRGPDSARNLSNGISWGIMLLFVILLVLFLIRGYSEIPTYVLGGFAGLTILVGLILYISKRTY